MGKKLVYIIFIMFVVLACEDVYRPNLDQVENKLVIEALVTNDANQNFIRISKSRNFFDNSGIEMVPGATVELIDGQNQVYSGQETKAGYFTLDHASKPGEHYQLRVTAEGEIYESDVEEMPALPAFDSIYAESEHVTKYYYSSYGEPIAYDAEQTHTFIDLPMTDSLANYRFNLTKTLEWIILPPMEIGPPPPTIYGWVNFGSTGNFNIAGPADYGTGDVIKRHSLIELTKKLDGLISTDYIDQEAYMEGWVIDVNEYGMSSKTFNYYRSMVDQLEATGKLFDAVYAQLEPNIHCVSNPEKTVLGYFEVSSYKKFRYFVYSSRGSNYVYSHLVHKTDPFPSADTIEAYQPPDFWINRFADE